MTVPKWVVRVGQIVLVVAVTYGIVRGLAPELGKIKLRDIESWKPNWALIVASLVLLTGVYLTHCMLWRSIAGRLGGIWPGARATLRIYFVSSLGRYIPGKLWQIAGMAMLAQQAGISPIAATAASVAAQIAFMSAGLVYLALTLPQWGNGGVVIGGAVILVGAVAVFLTRRWWRKKLGQKIGDALALIETIRWQDAVRWWIAYAITWVLLGTAFVMFVRAFTPLDHEQLILVAGTVAASYLAGYVFIFSMAGLGIREGVMFGLLSHHVVPAAGAIVISALSRLWFTSAELLPLALIPFAPTESVKAPLKSAESAYHE